jgi:hypothetical protein
MPDDPPLFRRAAKGFYSARGDEGKGVAAPPFPKALPAGDNSKPSFLRRAAPDTGLHGNLADRRNPLGTGMLQRVKLGA